MSTETCGTCHTGRVRVPGSGGDDIVYLYGGVNNQFDIRMWRTSLEKTVATLLQSESSRKATAALIRKLVAKKGRRTFLSRSSSRQSSKRLVLGPRPGRGLPRSLDCEDGRIHGRQSEAAPDLLPDGRRAAGSEPGRGQGYAAPTLSGIWARSPYLHNGSVPTLRHLLLPSTRPDRFVVGSLDFDVENAGFSWDEINARAIQARDPQARIFDSRMNGLGHGGHDLAELVANGKTYRLDWTPKAGRRRRRRRCAPRVSQDSLRPQWSLSLSRALSPTEAA